MEMSDQLHAPAAYTWGYSPRYPLGGTRSRSGPGKHFTYFCNKWTSLLTTHTQRHNKRILFERALLLSPWV